jgi:hypothetical protein
MNSFGFGRSFTSTKALVVSDRHTERSVGGISYLEAILRPNDFIFISSSLYKQLSQCELYILKGFRIT